MKNIDTQQLDSAVEQIAVSLKNILNDAINNKDVRMKSLVSIDFNSDDGQSIYGKGLVWTDNNTGKQFIYRGNPDRIWTTESIDLDNDQEYMIAGVPVLSEKTLGSSVRESSLRKVGTLQNLNTQGNMNFDGTVFYNSDTQSLGIGTPSPKGILNIVSYESDFVIDSEDGTTKLGNISYSNLDIVTDNTPRISISSNGHIVFKSKTTIKSQLGVNVNNVPTDVDLAIGGGFSFSNTKFETNNAVPDNGNYTIGDIVWNSNPKPTGYVGWVCIQTGTPGEWRPFGQIAS